MNCRTCGTPQETDTDFCTTCGYSLSQPVCRTCSTALREDSDTCALCGTPVGRTPKQKPPARDPKRLIVLAGASLGVLVLLGVVWLLTSWNADSPAVAAPTTTAELVESTLRTVPRSEPTTTTTTEPPQTTTTTLSVEQQAYMSALSVVLSDAEGAAGDLTSASTAWDLQKDSLDASARSRLWRITQGAFSVAIIRLEEIQTSFEAIEVPEGSNTHLEVAGQLSLVIQYAEESLEGLRLPRGSEEVDGTMRLEAIANLNATLDTLRALING